MLDDGSTDGTADVVRAAAAGDGRLRLVAGPPLPEGWLGKPHACAALAEEASTTATVLAFVDADVTLRPHAIAAAVTELRAAGAGLLTPYPRILTGSVGERLVQPLLQWSWLTFLPLRAMERSPRPSLAAAGGQFLVVDRAAYDRAGGHAAVRGEVLEDLALARAVKRTGGRIALADGSRLADCRMYTSWRELADGYGKSLWASFGSPAGATAVVGTLLVLYAVPPVLAIAGAATGDAALAGAGAAAYLLGVAGRVVSARATGGRPWPDALAQPLSILVFAGLVVRSFRRRRRGALAGTAGDAVVSEVVVIGAGVGGLACAIRLAQAGHRVTVLEASTVVGGKLGRYERDGFVFDTGPSLLTLPQVFDDLLGPGTLPAVPLDPIVRHRFPDGSTLDSTTARLRRPDRRRVRAGGRRRLGTPVAAGRPGVGRVVARHPARAGRAALAGPARLAGRRPGRGRPGSDAARVGPPPSARPAAADAARPLRDVHRRRPAPGAGRAGRDPVRGADLRRLVSARRPRARWPTRCWPAASHSA